MQIMYSYAKDLNGASSIPIILSLLQNQDSYGYKIIHDVTLLSEGDLHWNEGTVYPLLSKLEGRNLIKSYYKSVNGRDRKYYKITSAGVEFLSKIKIDWLSLNKVLLTMWKPQ